MKLRQVLSVVLSLAVMFSLLSVLVVAQSPTAPRASDKIEPELLAQMESAGQVGYLIYLRPEPDLTPAYQMDWLERGQFVVDALQRTAERSQAGVRVYLDKQDVAYQAFWIDNVIAVEGSNRAVLFGVAELAEVEIVRAKRLMGLIEPESQAEAADSPQAIEPNISHVRAPDAWSLGYTGQDLGVANIDTGVRHTHNALRQHYRGNLGGGSFNHNYNWLDPDTDNSAPFDDHGHGSHTMGTMIGDDGAGNQIGMAPGAQWIACDACNTYWGCPDYALLTCAQWIAAPYPIGNPGAPDADLRPHVVNNSWGDCSRGYDGWYQGVVNAWHAAGIYPVFANGNASNCGYPSPPGCNSVGNPGRYGNVTGVGSTGRSNGQYATHSNWGPTDNPDTVNPNGYPNLKPQVVAPGVSIRSSLSGSDWEYASWGGTSMSAPHVSGLIALMWQAAPCLVGDYAATETLLEETATPIPYSSSCGGEGPGNVPNQATGWGEIDALGAVQAACNHCSATLEPTAHFQWEPFTVHAGAPIQFVDASDGPVEQWHWTFSDGGEAFTQNTSHTFASTGNFVVTLEVTTGAGYSDQKSMAIVVREPGFVPIRMYLVLIFQGD